jgi:S-sulfosulfanyl-L-cysteine sulfohydrolase
MEKRLTIVQMNDTHAYMDLHPELFWEKGRTVYRMAGGYARIAALLKQIRSENGDQVLLVDGGDTFHGTYPAVQTKGEALAPILNALAPMGMTAHWEFAYSPQGIQQLSQKLTYPVLAMNVFKKESGELFFKPYEVIEIAGLRVGLAGIAASFIDKMMPPAFSEGIYFTDGRKELPEVVVRLRSQEQVDLVVLVSHLGFPQDMQLMQEAPGVDIDLSAHTHHRLAQAVRQGTALVTQSGSHGSFLTRLDLVIDNGKITDYRHQLIEVSESIEPDREVEDLVRQALAPFQDELNEVVGETLEPLDRGQNFETTMDNLILEALLDHTGTQAAFSNGWRYGAPVMAGPVRTNDLYNIVPVDPPVSTVDISGAEMKQMLEENLEHTFSRDPFQQMGGYLKRAMGIRAYIKIENPPMHRIHKLFIAEEEVKPEKIYQAAFITEQGVPGKYGHNRKAHDEKMVAVMRKYIQKKSPVQIGLHQTFVAI